MDRKGERGAVAEEEEEEGVYRSAARRGLGSFTPTAE